MTSRSTCINVSSERFADMYLAQCRIARIHRSNTPTKVQHSIPIPILIFARTVIQLRGDRKGGIAVVDTLQMARTAPPLCNSDLSILDSHEHTFHYRGRMACISPNAEVLQFTAQYGERRTSYPKFEDILRGIHGVPWVDTFMYRGNDKIRVKEQGSNKP